MKKKLKKFKIPQGPYLKKLKDGKNLIFEKKKYKNKDLTFKDKNKKISIVLDTQDNKRIIPFVKNSDLLICESTYADYETDRAKIHLHLTSKQGGEIAKKSKSKKLVITHISHRYENRLNEILKQTKKIFKNTTIAKDLDSIEI